MNGQFDADVPEKLGLIESEIIDTVRISAHPNLASILPSSSVSWRMSGVWKKWHLYHGAVVVVGNGLLFKHHQTGVILTLKLAQEQSRLVEIVTLY